VPTKEELDKAAKNFRDAHDGAAKLPDRTRAAFDQLIAALRVGSVGPGVVVGGSTAGLPGAVLGGVAAGVAGNLIIDDLEGKREEILAKLDELLRLLQEAAEGIAAPYTFIECADAWQEVGSTVRDARNEHFDKGDLAGYWEGTAAERYSAARGKQDTALETAAAMCDEVHNNLLVLSEVGRDFYARIGTTVIEFLGRFSAVLVKIATVVGAPLGVSDAIDLAAASALYMKEQLDLTLELLAKQKIVSHELENSTDSPYGLPGNKWPKATADSFSDATVADDTPSGWQISE
jgi:hypothetical protein